MLTHLKRFDDHHNEEVGQDELHHSVGPWSRARGQQRGERNDEMRQQGEGESRPQFAPSVPNNRNAFNSQTNHTKTHKQRDKQDPGKMGTSRTRAHKFICQTTTGSHPSGSSWPLCCGFSHMTNVAKKAKTTSSEWSPPSATLDAYSAHASPVATMKSSCIARQTEVKSWYRSIVVFCRDDVGRHGAKTRHHSRNAL